MLLSFLNHRNHFLYFSYHSFLWLLLGVVTNPLLSFSFPERCYDFFPTLSQRWNESILSEWCLFTGLSSSAYLFYWLVQWIEDTTLLIRCYKCVEMYGLGDNATVNSLLVPWTTYPVCVAGGWLTFPAPWHRGHLEGRIRVLSRAEQSLPALLLCR